MKNNLVRLLLATAPVGALSLVVPAGANARSDIDVSKLVLIDTKRDGRVPTARFKLISLTEEVLFGDIWERH